MTTKTTLNKIFTLIEAFGVAHGQVQTTLFGDEWDVNNTKNQHGAVVRFFPDSASVLNSSMEYTLVVEIMDEVLDDDTNRKDVLSDTFEIAMDFISFMNYYGENIESDNQTNNFHVIKDSLQILPFFDRKESNYWGHQVTIRINMPHSLSACQIPGVTLDTAGVPVNYIIVGIIDNGASDETYTDTNVKLDGNPCS